MKPGRTTSSLKPFNRTELRARVKTITRLNRYRTLMEQREDLREMAERVVTAQEQERQRISRELHDDFGQALTTHMLALRNLQDDLSIPVVSLFASLQALYEQSYEISVKIRRLAQDLRPPVLDALGLRQAMQTYCAEFTRRTKLPVTLEFDSTLPTLPDLHNITLYRVLQESLNNVAKHADAAQVWVDLAQEEENISLTVQDNGRGFVLDESKSNGIGITGLTERLALAGGKILFRSTPGRGTILMAHLPIRTHPHDQKEKS